MERESSPILFIATEQTLAVTLDPAFSYAPPELAGTLQWVELTEPTPDDPRRRLS
jgi:hypothetical protein